MRARDRLIVEAAREAVSLDEVMERVESESGRAISRRRAARRLRRAWPRAARADLPPLVASTDDGLPGTSRVIDGVRWTVHGVVHGQRRFARVAPDVVDAVRAGIARWAAHGDLVLLEPGFARAFGADPAHGLAIENPFRTLAGRDVAGTLSALGLAVVLLPVWPLVTALSRDPEWRYLRAAMRDPRMLAAANEAHVRLRIPAPLESEVSGSSGRFRLAYSHAMFDAAVARANATPGRDVHLVVGLAHVPDLVWMLGSGDPDLEPHLSDAPAADRAWSPGGRRPRARARSEQRAAAARST